MCRPSTLDALGYTKYEDVWRELTEDFNTVFDLGAGFCVWCLLIILLHFDNDQLQVYAIEKADRSLKWGMHSVFAHACEYKHTSLYVCRQNSN